MTKEFDRPQTGDLGNYITTPRSVPMLQLLGGINHGPVSLTCDEHRALERLYGFTREENPVLQAGADRNLFRHANADGLRIIAWLAKYCYEGQDPLKLVIELAGEAGLDVPHEDTEYAGE